MDAPAGDYRLLRYWTSEWPRHLGFELWCDLLKRKLLDADVKQVCNTPFHVRAHLRVLDEVRFGWGEVDASLYRRTRGTVKSDNDDFLLFMNLEGTFVASQSGREISLRPGDAYLMACAEPAAFDRPTAGKLLCVRVPSEPLASAVSNIYDRTACLLPRETESLRLLAAYIQSLNNSVPLANPGNRALVARYTCDLIALMLGATRDAAAAAEARGLSAVRLQAIKTHIASSLGKIDLSVGAVATEHGMTARQVQRLFEAENTTFSEFLLDRRLERVHRALKRPVCSQRISEIALENGFGDLSHFNRAFRRRFGETPSDTRKKSTAAKPTGEH